MVSPNLIDVSKGIMKKKIKKVTKEKLASALKDDKKKIRSEGEKRKALYGKE